jgi:hypothetical protein
MKYLIPFILLVHVNIYAQEGFIIDHNCIDIDSIPSNWIDSAKTKVFFAYAHASHGSQPISGMTGIEDFYGSPYLYATSDQENNLVIDDYITGFYGFGRWNYRLAGWFVGSENKRIFKQS